MKLKRRWWQLTIVIGFITLILAVALATFPLLFSRQGWSKDTVVRREGMTMLIQFKTDPNPPVVGPVNLMARVKSDIGYTIPVDRLVFTWSVKGREITRAVEGMPIGKFGTQGDGIYLATAEFPYPDIWQIEVQITHRQVNLTATFPLDIKVGG
jgi:hypothetical protein